MLTTYGSINLFSIQDSTICEWEIPVEATHAKIVLPASPITDFCMAEKGYILGDRTVLCSIPTRHLSDDLERGIRAKASMEKANHEAMFELSKSAFWGDRRFYITPDCNQEVAECVLNSWISDLSETLVCRIKDKYAGFLALTQDDDSTLCVNLAATDEHFRLAGAAMALYTQAMRIAHERNYTKLVGRISTRNIPVMNLYAHLGAKFSEPLDIFLKEIR